MQRWSKSFCFKTNDLTSNFQCWYKRLHKISPSKRNFLTIFSFITIFPSFCFIVISSPFYFIFPPFYFIMILKRFTHAKKRFLFIYYIESIPFMNITVKYFFPKMFRSKNTHSSFKFFKRTI